jgi:hypothetical protein
MKITNNQINNKAINLLSSLKGKTLKSIVHERFKFTPTSYGIVYLVIGDKKYIFTDYQEPMDYFKAKEDISSIKFEEYEGEMKSSLDDVDFVTEEIKQKISKITLVNTKQTATSKETGESYQFLDTQCIIFTLDDDYQLSLIKDDFCECISIYRGYEALKEIDDITKRFENFYGPDLEGTYSIDCIDL